eukprot:CAMPEP_0115030106 /NCGR_PEP_ID=MMETSP0216-20121206/37512_1 /TAXON_ID=223996 /ORGANISM="Protocruzia adherens, Strain Boccale" /LENGTH=510 /DNA_ID=CAMNT_0002407045 /DNA_START=242 /DNA_END=1774 /DNA_ORIENTATION=+
MRPSTSSGRMTRPESAGAFRIRPSTPVGGRASTNNGILATQESFFSAQDNDDDAEQQLDTYGLYYLTKMCGISGQDLGTLQRLELNVNTGVQSLQRIGQLCPCLTELVLSESQILSLRDLGTCWTNLEVLWINRTGLADLGGLSAFQSLQEFYGSYNRITDCGSFMCHDAIVVIDLEGNEIDDLSSVDDLVSCPNLNYLNLSVNPVAKQKSYRRYVVEMLPRLNYLDDTRLSDDPQLSFASEGSSPEWENINPNGASPQDDVKGADDEPGSNLDLRKLLKSAPFYRKLKKRNSLIARYMDIVNLDELPIEENIKKIVEKEPDEDILVANEIKNAQIRKKRMNQHAAAANEFNPNATGSSFRPRSAGPGGRSRNPASLSNGFEFSQTTSRPQPLFGGVRFNSMMERGSRGNSEAEEDTDSSLTRSEHSFAGNPLKALRHKRANMIYDTNDKGVKEYANINKLISDFKSTGFSQHDESQDRPRIDLSDRFEKAQSAKLRNTIPRGPIKLSWQ